MMRLDHFISKYITGRKKSLFDHDVQNNSDVLIKAISGKSMLACMLGENREICFPKLDAAQMKTFSDIATDFLHESGYEVLECASKAEALKHGSRKYPVHYSRSDTTGEKPYEEFFTAGEQVDMGRFEALGVVTGKAPRPAGEIQGLFDRLEAAFTRNDTTKAEVVGILKDFLPGFEHEEKGRSLDGKM